MECVLGPVRLSDPLLIIAPALQYDISSIVLLPINNHINSIRSGCVKRADMGAHRILSASITTEKMGVVVAFNAYLKLQM